ncbi:efflux RND transporter periplasmic adaptor subunit [Ottowia beijingensis]|uniref:Efflux RND transporter periplasmic adaptor subunit n=1 Tax=Ottowia beijingensis TaxID=1207057 RepID=A0A853IU38_9BURK|nr:efflux RND transporter periplasmic adaptor subunit [Ottowia beijingensis]NZA02715.1 efflux RND transporter periplasmic adaptor subunit [Ottowia beijingensis]
MPLVSPPWRALGGALLVALLAACGKAPPPEEPVRAVKLVTVGETAYEAGHEYAAEVRARVESRLGFRVAGKIVRRAVEPGQRVQAGQLLAQLDARDYQLAADAARAQVASATTQRDLAAADLKRFQSLRDQGFISGAEMERRSAQLKAAQATLDQARAQQSSQGNQAAYTQLLADAGGVVTGVDAEVGQVVAAGTPVVRLAQDGPRDVVFAVPEDRVAAVRVGQPVTVRAWASDGQWHGSVREVAAAADPVTRTYAVKVALAGEAPPLGATVTVVPQQSGAQGAAVIKLPTSALRREGAGTAVWVFDEASSSVRSQPVQVAGADGNEAVIADGLTPGMRVVASGVHVLAPGQKVSVYQSKTATAPAKTAQAATNNVANEPAPPAVAASR